MIHQTLLLALAALAQPASQPSTPAAGPAPTAQVPAAPPSTDFQDAADLLAALEKADEGLDQFQAEIRYDRTLDLEGERQVRMGKLYFDRAKIGERTVRRFAVCFEQFIVGTAQRTEQRFHVFDGAWYADKMPAEKKINRKEVVGPGQSFDPMKLGEGPMPIPIGQKKDDILARYNAQLVPVEDGLGADDAALKAFLAGSTQIRLTPKAGAAPGGDAFEEIRLWYRGKRPEKMGSDDKPSARLLPRAARTVSVNKDVSIVQLLDIRVNTEAGTDGKIDPTIMDTKAPEGWEVTEVRLPTAPSEKPAEAKPADADSGKPSNTPQAPATDEKKDAPK
jgi:hypothetical protein